MLRGSKVLGYRYKVLEHHESTFDLLFIIFDELNVQYCVWITLHTCLYELSDASKFLSGSIKMN